MIMLEVEDPVEEDLVGKDRRLRDLVVEVAVAVVREDLDRLVEEVREEEEWEVRVEVGRVRVGWEE